MPRISYAFFTLAALCGLTGMAWGIAMGAMQNFTTAPAHAHLNLLGWLSLSVMGVFYALADGAVPAALARGNLLLSGAGAVCLPAGIACILLDRPGGPLLAFSGGFLAIGGMLSFLVAILIAARRGTRTARAAA